LNINDYITWQESTINSCPSIASSNLNIDRKSDEIAFLSGFIAFRNGSILDFKEFIEETDKGIEKYKYAYNYRKGSFTLFRYYNAPDPRAKNIKTFPCHKHLEDGNITESKHPELTDIINEIENIFISEDKD